VIATCHICGLEPRLRVRIPTNPIYQYPESADGKLMNDTNTLRDSARPIRRAIILERFRTRIREPEAIHVKDYGEGYSAKEETKLALEEAAAAPIQVGDVPPYGNIKKTVAGLENVCKEEQKIIAALSGVEHEISAVAAYRKAVSMWAKEELGMDTSILGGIRSGEWPPDEDFQDLLAPLRLQSQAPDAEESYEDMQAWNQHVAGSCKDDPEARQVFIAALETRIKAVEKVLAIVRDERNIDQSNKIGQEGILEPSKRRLLKAIHAYRPETQKFKNQDPFNLLVVMWANIGRANPDITGDDDCMYLTYKLLNGEAKLERRFEREEKRRTYKAEKQAAELKGDTEKIDDCKKRWNIYNKNLASAARQQIIDKLKCARRNLRDVELDEQLELTALQAAQQWAGKDAHPGDWIPRWTERLDQYEEKDVELESKIERCFPDLESTAEVTAHRVQGMAMLHATVLTRSHKITGKDLVGMNEATKKAVLQARLGDSLTPMMMKLTKDGVLESQQVARQMLRHVGAMEESLSELLEAAKTKHEEVELLSLFVDQDGKSSIVGDVETEKVNELPRRETLEEDVDTVAPIEHGEEV
jgi:hypothetical protein